MTPLYRRTRTIAPPVVVVVIAAVLMGVVLGGAKLSLVDTAARIALLIAVAHAWNLLAGFAGLISLGTSAFVGAGAYTVAMAVANLGWPWWAALLLVVPAMLVVGYLLSIPLLRLRADYFAIGSFAALLALHAIASNLGVFGRSMGVPMPTAALPDPRTTAALAIAVAAVTVLAVVYLSVSRFGLRLQAIRDNEAAAKTLGVAVKSSYLIVFVLSSVLTGLAGGVLALQDGSATPANSFAMSWTIGALLMATVGGVGTVTGPVMGVFVVYWLLQKQLEDFAALSLIIQGALLIVLVRAAPTGIWPPVKRLGKTILLRTRDRRLASAGKKA
ncbi:ABC transporter permease subunit [Microbacterium ulmi]|uniref:ABC transporter permease subunit n=1 Tax=Microbacterium ulmi TaxID=179095 RepID=UPI0014218235